jgi:hypothetical protein
MRYFTYPWKEGEIEELLSKNSIVHTRANDRFIGPLLPFLGGVLIGGLFLPRPNQGIPYGPVYPVQPLPYVAPAPYVSEVPTYSVPVNGNIKK